MSGFEALLAVLNTIYPTVWIDVVQQKNGRLPVQSMDQVAARQTGIYRLVAKLTPQQLSDTVAAHCGSCVRHPTWFVSSETNLSASSTEEVSIPCPEPCQCWMSFALQQVEANRQSKVDLELSPDELESLRAALRAALAQPDSDVRPDEYEDPRNPARLRALLTKLEREQ